MANLAPLHRGSRRSFVFSYLRPSSEEAGSKTLKIDSASGERLDGYTTISIRVDKPGLTGPTRVSCHAQLLSEACHGVSGVKPPDRRYSDSALHPCQLHLLSVGPVHRSSCASTTKATRSHRPRRIAVCANANEDEFST
jgi:hypothetical protein